MKGVSEKMLISQLKELEEDGLVLRLVYPQVAPRVEYELSEKGKTLEKILIKMNKWGEYHRNK